MKIFISHSMRERDAKVLSYLKERIKSYGFEPFFIEHSFKNSSMYLTEKMKEEILDSEIILVFLSEDAATSQSVNHEI